MRLIEEMVEQNRNIIKRYRIETTNKILEIYADEDAISPRDDCANFGTMIFWHKRYKLGDRHDYSSPDDFNKKDYLICLPVYIYEHSGLTISTKPFSCPWDSGQLGWIAATKEQVVKEYGSGSNENIEKAAALLKSEVKTYNQYLRGDVYGFILKNEDGEEEDSCWGFYGDDPNLNGMLEVIDC